MMIAQEHPTALYSQRTSPLRWLPVILCMDGERRLLDTFEVE